MTTELLEIMRTDIKRCEDAQASSNGTHSLYQALIAKYNGIFEDFGKDIPTSGKACAVGSALNYRPELNAIKEKLELRQIKKKILYLILNLCMKKIWNL